jgi:hypothetical protein
MKTYKELVEGINETLSLLEEVEGLHEDLGKHLAHAVKHLGIAQIGDVDHPEKHEKKFHDAVEKVRQSHGEQAAKDFHAHAHDEAHHLTGSGPGERGSQFHKHMSDSEKKSYTKHFNKLLGEEVEELDELSTDTLRKYRTKAKDDAYDAADVDDDRRLRKRSMGSWDAGKKILKRGDKLRAEEFDFDLFESIMLGEGDLSIRTLYNKYADHALGSGDSPEPKKAAAVKKAITKVHGSTVMGHLEKAKNAAAKNDQDSESHHFNAARNAAKTDTMSATVGKNRSSMRKEEFDLDESRMKDLATDMESLSHADFKRKHRRTKQEMQSSLKSEELKGNQHKIDANKNGKVDGHDFKILRNQKKARYQ